MKVAHVGNLANCGYNCCRLLRKHGVDAHLYTTSRYPTPSPGEPLFEPDSATWVHRLDFGPRGLRSVLRQVWFGHVLCHFDVVHSWTVSIPYWSLLVLVLRGKKYLAHATGSDLREKALENTRGGRRARLQFQKAALVVHGYDRMQEIAASTIGLTNTIYLRSSLDTEVFRPLDRPRLFPEFQVLFFMPSHLDWGERDSHPSRVTSKNNDRFVRAFARYVKIGGDAGLLMLERGPDLEPARQLCANLDIDSHVRWLPEVSQSKLIELFAQVDVVVDQFGKEGYPLPGGIGREAMACGKPVMFDLDVEGNRRFYSEPPPLLNCCTEEEIYQQIVCAMDAGYRRRIGEAARAWMVQNHSPEVIIPNLLEQYTALMTDRPEELHVR